MDRYNQVKVLLKNWEQEFVKEHQRKADREDIDQAPEEVRDLYKEYRSLKQAKDNSSSNAASAQPAAEPMAAQRESDCWGSHLNRSVMPVHSPKLSSQDRHSLKASSKYYGLKLKNNLATLNKERPISLKKFHLPGRTPLNSLNDGQTTERKCPSSIKTDFSLSRENLVHGCQASKSLHPVEPEEPFKQFKPVKHANDEPADAASSCSVNSKSIDNMQEITTHISTSTVASSPATSSTLMTSLSPSSERTSDRDKKENVEAFKTQIPFVESVGTLTGLKGSPQFAGGLRGTTVGKGFGGKPSPANRLSSLDRKWLERCQVFGEMEAEEKPGAGNQELKVEKGMAETDGMEELNIGVEEMEKNIKRKKMSRDISLKTARAGGEKERKMADEEMEAASLKTPEDGTENDPKSKPLNKRGTKRQRERDDTEADGTEDGGVKKRQRKSKKKESSDMNHSPAPGGGGGGGGKKRRTKKRGEEEGEGEQVKEAKEGPKKEPQENLLGELEEEFEVKKIYRTQYVKGRVTKGADGNFVKINLKKKSHVKGYALRGMALRKQLYMQKFQLKGERFGGGGGYFGRGRRGSFRGGFSRQSDTCYKCGGTGHWAIDCKGRAPPPPVPEDKPAEEEPFELPTLEDVARATGTLRPQSLAASPSVSEEQHQQEKEGANKHDDEVLLNVVRSDYERPAPPPPMEPLFLLANGKVQETPEEVYAGLRDLGYKSFRAGQEEAIMRILSGLSTLVVLSTGMGKSLCYQLPAYLYAQRSRCITLVISPLVSLMDDQVSGLSTKLKAACIHSNMSMKQREATIEKVKAGQVFLLLLSPEALVGGGGSGSGCLPAAQELPPVAFACIDEAHCVSEWSHNFRPCYLRLCKVLRERLGVQCLLGLTATATLSTALDIAQHLGIHDQDGVAVRSAAVPPNLNLSVSMDKEKDQALVALLRGDRFGCLDSIIVYCTRREETVRVAALLRTCLQGVLVKDNKQISSSSQTNTNPVGQKKKELARKKIRKPLKWQAEAYHAGLSGSERRRVQNNFMCGELRIVVATVAFGMGLDKSDVRGIIHYNMPKSFESYVQEIGRAGRDGEPAHCHLFLDPEGEDLHELRRHIYADTVDYYTVKRLVQKVFPACKCKKIHQKQQELLKDVEDSELMEMMDVYEDSSINLAARMHTEKSESTAIQEVSELPVQDEGREKDESIKDNGDKDQQVACDWPTERVCHTHERAIPIQETVEALDITEEGVETLLCYLELHPQTFVELLHPTMSVCKVSCYDGPKQLQGITKICPPVAVVLARRRMAGERVELCDQLEFDVVEVADTMGWQLPLVKRGLRQLQWSTRQGGGRSGVLVEFSSPSFHFRSYGDLTDEEMDRVCQFLHTRVQDQESLQLYQLTSCFKAFKSVAFHSVLPCVDNLDAGRSLQLKSLLSEYFDKRRDRDHTLKPVQLEELDKYKLFEWENQIRADIRGFLVNRSDEKFSGRAVARILHGIGSPCYPAQVYGKDRRYWRKYIQFDFNQLIRLATQEIIHFK